MLELQYGFVNSNNLLLEIFVVNENDTETLERIKTSFNLAAYYKITDLPPIIKESYWDGNKFSTNRPFPSWTWNLLTNDWTSPISYPQDGLFYQWDEETTSWLLLPPA